MLPRKIQAPAPGTALTKPPTHPVQRRAQHAALQARAVQAPQLAPLGRKLARVRQHGGQLGGAQARVQRHHPHAAHHRRALLPWLLLLLLLLLLPLLLPLLRVACRLRQ